MMDGVIIAALVATALANAFTTLLAVSELDANLL